MKVRITMQQVVGEKKSFKEVEIKGKTIMDLLKSTIIEKMAEVKAEGAYIIGLENIDIEET